MSEFAENPPLRCAITDRTRFPGNEQERQAALVRNATRWAAEGLDFIQLREKDLAAGALAALARKLLEALGARDPAPRLLVNSRADVAIAVAAAGVHLTAAPGELTPGQVRRLYAAAGLPEPIVSVSCHTLDDVARAVSPEPGAGASPSSSSAQSSKKWPLKSAPAHNPSPQAAASTCSAPRAPPPRPRRSSPSAASPRPTPPPASLPGPPASPPSGYLRCEYPRRRVAGPRL
jgi:hypothetical protein